MLRRFAAALAAAWFMAACSSSSPTFSLSGATVDPTYRCPGGASNAPYDVHATIKARNDTSKAVTIQSATAEMVLAAIKGKWLEPVGDRYDAGSVAVSPTRVAAGSSATLTLTIPSACTSGPHGSTTSSSGSYQVKLHLVTSAGAFSIDASNRHEILAA